MQHNDNDYTLLPPPTPPQQQRRKLSILPKLRHKNRKSVLKRSNAYMNVWHKRILKIGTKSSDFPLKTRNEEKKANMNLVFIAFMQCFSSFDTLYVAI